MITDISHINLDDPKITFVQHTKAEDIFFSFWNFDDKMILEEILEGEVGSLDGEGNESFEPISVHLKEIIENKFWAFSNFIKNEVHLWISEKMETEALMIIIAHEIGHILESRELSDQPHVAEEERADNYGKAAVLTNRMISLVIQPE